MYLLSEKGEPRYAVRPGLTERAKRSGKGHSNFLKRIEAHTYPSDNSGTYAYHLTCELFRENGRTLKETRKANWADANFMKEFKRQCARVEAVDVRVMEISDNDALAVVFEVYVATVLNLPQSFATS